METNNIDNLRFDIDGQAYFLHHTPADIAIGDKIRVSGIAKQVTAGDALSGFSYGWDAMSAESASNAINNQISARNIYITTAPASEVFPDINVVGSSARAIRGEQTVLEKITVGADESFENAHARVLSRLQELNIPVRSPEDSVLANLEMAISERGVRAVQDYAKASAETKLNSIIEVIEEGRGAYQIPENFEELKGLMDEEFYVSMQENGRPIKKGLKFALQSEAYQKAGREGLIAEIARQEGSLEAITRRPEVIKQSSNLIIEAGEYRW